MGHFARSGEDEEGAMSSQTRPRQLPLMEGLPRARRPAHICGTPGREVPLYLTDGAPQAQGNRVTRLRPTQREAGLGLGLGPGQGLPDSTARTANCHLVHLLQAAWARFGVSKSPQKARRAEGSGLGATALLCDHKQAFNVSESWPPACPSNEMMEGDALWEALRAFTTRLRD